MPQRGFTLLEILLVLGLIGLLAGVLISGSARLLADRPVTVEAVFWEAAAATRRDALQHNHDVTLRYDAKARAFVGTFYAGEARFPVPEGEVKVDFLPAANPTGAGLVLIGGLLVDTRTLPSVTFYGDGTCQPFRVQVATGGPVRTLAIDPWTCAPVLGRNDQ
ncbi:MAG TPA: prepilin-type N-terminal cleavage/methylation domain-containing protein [Opitutaceae bacterium]